MGSRVELSWESVPHDGASATVGFPPSFDRAEYDELFRAWCQERHECIELKFCLEETVRLLTRLMSEGEVSVQSRRRAKRLLHAIKDASERGDGG